MGEYSKPKVTIDLEEYNTLLENSNPEAIIPYKTILEGVLNMAIYPIGMKPIDVLSIRRLANSVGYEINITKHGNQLEIESIAEERKK